MTYLSKLLNKLTLIKAFKAQVILSVSMMFPTLVFGLVNISGEATPTLFQHCTYEVVMNDSNAGTILGVNWDDPVNATILAESFTLSVRWDVVGVTTGTISGTATVKRYSDDAIISQPITMNVSINTSIPAAPTTPEIQSLGCETAVLQWMSGSAPAGSTIKWYWQDTQYGESIDNETSTHTITESGTYYLRSKVLQSATVSWGWPSEGLEVTVPETIVVEDIAYEFSSTGLMASVVSEEGKYFRIEKKPSSGTVWEIISNTSAALVDFSQNTDYRAAVSNDYCPEVYSTTKTFIFSTPPIITVADGPGSLKTLSTSGGAYIYKWYLNGLIINDKRDDSNSIVVSEPGSYKLITLGAQASIGFSQPVEIDFPLTKPNDIVSKSIIEEGIQNLASINNTNAVTQISYTDGLGRTMQTINKNTTPDGNHMVSFYEYDETGQSSTSYLPMVVSSTEDGSFLADAKTRQASFYTTNSDPSIATDAKPWSRTLYESSPAKRMSESGSVGAGYQIEDNHSTKYAYSFNDVDNDQVFKWVLNDDGDLYLSGTKYYAANTLSKSTVSGPDAFDGDEDYRTYSFSNHLGQKILTRYYSDTDQFDTYYVYDDFGQVVYIIPPLASQLTRDHLPDDFESNRVFTSSMNFPTAAAIPPSESYYYLPGVVITLPPTMTFTNGFSLQPYPEGLSVTDSQADGAMANLVFKNTYDNRNRLIEKKVPSAEAVHYIYDDIGRLILSQDGNQRASNRWTFTKYDYADRPILTGEVEDSRSRAVLETYIQTQMIGSNRYETRGSDRHGYSNNVWPTTVTEDDYLVVSYYDDYEFKSSWSSDYDPDDTQTDYDIDFLSYPRGLETGGKIKVLGTTSWLKSVKYYNDDRILVQGVSDHHLGRTERSFTAFSWIGELTHTRFEHELDGGKILTIDERFIYDDQGRVLEQYHSIDGEPEVFIATYAYNELGDLIEKNLHEQEDGTFVQSVDYRYSVRGQTTNINQASRNTLLGDTDQNPDRFGLSLHYDSSPTGLSYTPQTNGQLAGTTWGHAAMSGATQRSFGYEYDAASRLTAANYREGNGSSWNTKVGHHNVSNITYNLNGNIETLTRKQDNTVIDDLDYDYDGNQLTSVDDQENNAKGFDDQVEDVIEYMYDDNGNVISDGNKLITSIIYNILNKPSQVNFSNGDHIDYTYDAAGTRLHMSVTSGGTVIHEKDYSSGLIFEDGQLSLLSMPQGRVVVEQVANDVNYDYQYHLTDHLGNVRATVAPIKRTYFASMESDASVAEEAQFLNVADTRYNNNSYDHTDVGSTYNKSARLNPASGNIVGPAKALKVYAGDVIDMEVWARSNTSTSQSGASGILLDAITAAYGLQSGSEVLTAISNELSGKALLAQAAGEVPKAYLNFIFFDENNQNLPSGFVDITSASRTAFEELTLSYTAPSEGYLFVFVSNETSLNADVYFDDFKITHTSSASVLQADDYYPFGLPIAANKQADIGNKENRFLYQGKEWQTELALNLYDFHARQYDPATGRFLGVDPQDQFASGYVGMGNMPTMGTDPDGEFFFLAIALAADFIEQVPGLVEGLGTGDWSNFDFDVNKEGSRFNNALRIQRGLFKTDENSNGAQRAWQLFSRFTFEAPLTFIGYNHAQATNVRDDIERVDYYAGATVSWNADRDNDASTIGNNINIRSNITYANGSSKKAPGFEGDFDGLLVHEYGHYVQARRLGGTLTLLGGINSGLSTLFPGLDHGETWWEKDASKRGFDYLEKKGHIDPDGTGHRLDDDTGVWRKMTNREYYGQEHPSKKGAWWEIASLPFSFFWYY